MARIKVERSGRGNTWVWLVVAVVLLIAAVVALDYAGYINLPFRLGALVGSGPAMAATAAAFTGEV
jgi:hypothetical protein